VSQIPRTTMTSNCSLAPVMSWAPLTTLSSQRTTERRKRRPTTLSVSTQIPSYLIACRFALLTKNHKKMSDTCARSTRRLGPQENTAVLQKGLVLQRHYPRTLRVGHHNLVAGRPQTRHSQIPHRRGHLPERRNQSAWLLRTTKLTN